MKRGFTLIEVLVVVTIIGITVVGIFSFSGCERPGNGQEPTSASGVSKARATVVASADFKGRKVTTEQWNILTRYDRDDDPTAVKHLYVISAYSGDCILYSTVRGKVTSSGKRLTPYSVTPQSAGTALDYTGFDIEIGGQRHYTAEVLQDDGTYGSSIHYLYWFDARGVMHKHYISGGQIVHVSDTPMAWPKIILNLETTALPSGK